MFFLLIVFVFSMIFVVISSPILGSLFLIFYRKYKSAKRFDSNLPDLANISHDGIKIPVRWIYGIHFILLYTNLVSPTVVFFSEFLEYGAYFKTKIYYKDVEEIGLSNFPFIIIRSPFKFKTLRIKLKSSFYHAVYLGLNENVLSRLLDFFRSRNVPFSQDIASRVGRI